MIEGCDHKRVTAYLGSVVLVKYPGLKKGYIPLIKRQKNPASCRPGCSVDVHPRLAGEEDLSEFGEWPHGVVHQHFHLVGMLADLVHHGFDGLAISS